MPQQAYLIIRDTDGRDGVGESPEIILQKVHTVVFEVLAAIAERLPVDFPLACRISKSTCKVGEITLIRLDGALCSLEFELDLFELLALKECRLRRIGIDPLTVVFVLFPCLVDVLFLGLLRLPVLLDHSLERLFVVGLAAAEGAGGAFDVGADRL
jgi:hypothetical protein